MDEKSNILSLVSLSMGIGWFIEENLNIIIGYLTIIVLISALIANIAKTRRENSKRRIDEYEHLNKELKNNEE